jgi:type IV secretion system protein VirB2
MRIGFAGVHALTYRDQLYLFFAMMAFAVIAGPAVAAGTNMPWEEPLQQILDSIEGPVAKVMSVIVIILMGLGLAFGESSGGLRRLVQIVFGLSIAVAASSFFLSFFQFGGGATI